MAIKAMAKSTAKVICPVLNMMLVLGEIKVFRFDFELSCLFFVLIGVQV